MCVLLRWCFRWPLVSISTINREFRKPKSREVSLNGRAFAILIQSLRTSTEGILELNLSLFL